MKEFVEGLLQYEGKAFLFLNGLHFPYLDSLMSFYTDKFIWIPVYILLLVLAFYKKNIREGILLIVALACVITLCDQTASSFFKPYFMRFRPSHHPDFKNIVHLVNGVRSGYYGFASSHAANGLGAAIFLSLVFKNRFFTITIIGWALLSAYTRIYLGLHFISDILMGFIIGAIIAVVIYYFYQLFRKILFFSNDKNQVSQSMFPHREGTLFARFIIAYILLILFFPLFV